MNKYLILLSSIFLRHSVSAQIKQSKSSNTKKLNIIFILADDLGTGEVGYCGSDNNNTPNIDKLSKTGLKLNHTCTALILR